MVCCFKVVIVVAYTLNTNISALSMGLCVSMIALLRLPSLKVSCLLLTGLLLYDVFWVFFSSYIFNANVMVQVATAQADNPVSRHYGIFHIKIFNPVKFQKFAPLKLLIMRFSIFRLEQWLASLTLEWARIHLNYHFQENWSFPGNSPSFLKYFI